MDIRRILIAFGLALVLALIVTAVVSKRLRESAATPKLTRVVVAAKDVPAGIALSAADVTLADWPATVPLPGSFSNADQVVGRPLLSSLGVHQPILERDLAVAGSGLGLSVKIPAGMRATAVRSNEVTGVAGFLFPGSRVDVLGTFNIPGSAAPAAQTILQNVEVLTAGQTIEPDPQGKPQTVNVVTLLLTPEDSQKMILASNQSTIQFVLRNGADKGTVDTAPTRMDQLVQALKPQPPVPPVRLTRRVTTPPPPPPPVVPKPPDVSIVEVIQGEKHSVEKF